MNILNIGNNEKDSACDLNISFLFRFYLLFNFLNKFRFYLFIYLYYIYFIFYICKKTFPNLILYAVSNNIVNAILFKILSLRILLYRIFENSTIKGK